MGFAGTIFLPLDHDHARRRNARLCMTLARTPTTDEDARRVMKVSLIYLPVVLLVMVSTNCNPPPSPAPVYPSRAIRRSKMPSQVS